MKSLLPNQIHCLTPQFVVTDIENSIRFYEDKLGFRLMFKIDDWFAGLECSDKPIHLKLGKPCEASKHWKTENGHVDLTFGVTEIESLYASLDENMEITQPLRTMPYGTEFYISDPDGYVLAFLDMDSTKSN